MITPEYCQTMARYNCWQNNNLYGAADQLSHEERQKDRGAFFGSIHGTLSHLLWGDTIWMHRFDGWELPEIGIPDSHGFAPEWDALCDQRGLADAAIMDWAERLAPADIEGQIDWYSKAVARRMSQPLAICIMQLFNHQTHHRGQVHAMLTAAGGKPSDTDLPFMPETC